MIPVVTPSEMAIIDEARLYNGLGMLVEQAADSFEHWFEHRPSTENIKKIFCLLYTSPSPRD